MEENKNALRMNYSDYIRHLSDASDSRSKSQYKKYLSLSDEQIKKIEELKNHCGKKVLYARGKSQIEMIIMCVADGKFKKTKGHTYCSWPYDIRLNYADYKTNKKRDWDGFWTMNIDKITLFNP
jgi:hypothetical protein